jgi:NAD(P)-dependent dehydrogenase (short-subunit alcohol dehydrogenase family)
MGRLDGKVCVVTGGALGIGRATCAMMVREGAKVAVCDVLDKEGGEFAQSLGPAAKYWPMDVTDEGVVSAAMGEIAAEFGGIHVLVNNAGIAGTSKPTHETTVEEWDAVQNVNVKGVFLCTKHAVPYIKKAGGGSIINLSSIYGLIGAPDAPSYHASKGAVRLMAKTDAMLYAKDKIRVNSVHPGFIWTPMLEHGIKNLGEPSEVMKMLEANTPVGHIGEPDDIAFGIVYLASYESKFVTGSELVIDGGYTCH